MTVPAEELAARAAGWARSDAAVRAAVVYGSVAQGTAGEHSDPDLIIVAEPGQRDALWARRAAIGELILGRAAAWSQEPSWQRPFRYQAWDDRQLTSDLARWPRPEFDAPALDGGTWAWLGYLDGRLARGEAWIVRCGVMDTLNNRVLPLLGTTGHSAHLELVPDDLDRVQRAAPASADPAELRRSLLATADLYDWALDRWAQRTGRPRPRHPLAPAVRRRLAAPAH